MSYMLYRHILWWDTKFRCPKCPLKYFYNQHKLWKDQITCSIMILELYLFVNSSFRAWNAALSALNEGKMCGVLAGATVIQALATETKLVSGINLLLLWSLWGISWLKKKKKDKIMLALSFKATRNRKDESPTCDFFFFSRLNLANDKQSLMFMRKNCILFHLSCQT